MTEFLPLGFSDVRDLQLFYFVVFLGIFLFALAGNLLVITTVALSHHLHTPMYFFLMNLSIIDLGSISVTVLKSMVNSLLNTKSISYTGCVAQVFLFIFFIEVDFAFLTIMAYDRFVAICQHCIMRGCFLLIIVSYIQIFSTVLRIPTERDQHKAFSTCLPHLIVVSLFICPAVFAYLKPTSISTSGLDLVVAVLYSVVPPMMNPIISIMRNKQIKGALRKLTG
ncbi:olfactory receptor 14I1-like [Emydura macquarii macquarii]|uniref:olfactory receptor 14I1-like n=1 Tax=Emydura macquarii macquarii TaxID=1129001 RepID=UPI00352B83E1